MLTGRRAVGRPSKQWQNNTYGDGTSLHVRLTVAAAVVAVAVMAISRASLYNRYQQTTTTTTTPAVSRTGLTCQCQQPAKCGWLTDWLTDQPTDRLSARDSVSIRRSVAGLSSRRPGFSPTKVHVEFVVEQHELQRFFFFRIFWALVCVCVCVFVCARHLLNTRVCTQMLILQWRHCVRWSEWKAVSRWWCQGNFACCFVRVRNMVSQFKWRTLG